MEKFTNAELNDRLGDYFELRNKKYLITLPGLNRLLLDPKCPTAKESPLVEYLLQVRTNLEDKQKTKKLNQNKKHKNNEPYNKTLRKSA